MRVRVINLRENGAYRMKREFQSHRMFFTSKPYKFHQLNLGVYLTVDPFVGGFMVKV